MRKMLIGMHHINVSQGQWMPYAVSSHNKLPAVDLTGEDTGEDYWKALDGRYRCCGIYGGAGGAGFIPIDAYGKPEQTELADGTAGYFGVYLVHDNNTHRKGTEYEIGAVMYTEGTKNSTANHIHCEVFRFDPSNPVLPERIVVTSGGIQTSRFPDGVYLDPSEIWYASDYSTIVKLDGSDGSWHQTFGITTLANARDSADTPATDSDVIVTRVKQDDEYEYRLSVDGNKYGTHADKTSYSGFHDDALVNDGWEECIKSNGSIFYSYDGATYAEGIEKSRGINNQDLNLSCVSKFINTMAIGMDYSGGIVFEKQSAIAAKINTYYGAVTGMFGIMHDGTRAEWGREIEAQRNNMYSNKSGRTIIGWSAVDHEYIWITIVGTTELGGRTGAQLFDIAKDAGCTDAICMDGGGSVFLVVDGVAKVKTSRLVKNAVILYRRKKTSINTDEIKKQIEEYEAQIDALQLKINELQKQLGGE